LSPPLKLGSAGETAIRGRRANRYGREITGICVDF